MLKKTFCFIKEHKLNEPIKKSYSESGSNYSTTKMNVSYDKHFKLEEYYGHECHKDPEE